jgi:hypothetical protein
VIERLAWNTGVVCVVLAVAAGVWSRDARVAGGVLAGGVLIGLALWALGGMVAGLLPGGDQGGRRRVRGAALVKFFTRHAILALVAYVTMVRWHLDPIGMIVGVSSVVVAAVIEAARPR